MARRRKERRQRRPQVGATPGTLVVAPHAKHKSIRVMRYDAEKCEEAYVDDVADLKRYLAMPGVCWLDLDEAPDQARFESLRQLLELHPLAVADAANVPQRPKHESYETFDFIVLRMMLPRRNGPGFDAEQVSLFLGATWVLTVQERPGDCLEPVRERLRAGLGTMRTRGADYLAYAICDTVVDAYFPIVESIGDHLEEIEAAVSGPADRKVFAALHELRRELLVMRRAIWPLREALNRLTREGEGRFTPATRIFVRDCADHATQLIDLVENYRELGASLVELHLSMIGFRTNEVMKVLTIFSTIFLPLTFIAGVYGMNFETVYPTNMPELRWRYGYLFSLALMLVSALGMLVFFRRKGWLGREKAVVAEDGQEADDGQ